MRARIGPSNERDVGFIGANMREWDRREILCQCPEGFSGSQAALACHFASFEDMRWIVYLGDEPEAAFGLVPITAVVAAAWAFGTKRLVRCIPAITRHALTLPEALIKKGYRRVEVRSLLGHDLADLWLSAIGGTVRATLEDHGRDGETFILWQWTRTAYEAGAIARRPIQRPSSHHLRRRRGHRPAVLADGAER